MGFCVTPKDVNSTPFVSASLAVAPAQLLGILLYLLFFVVALWYSDLFLSCVFTQGFTFPLGFCSSSLVVLHFVAVLCQCLRCFGFWFVFQLLLHLCLLLFHALPFHFVLWVLLAWLPHSYQ